jgi:hypothetical protein
VDSAAVDPTATGNAAQRVRVAVVDDHESVRLGLKAAFLDAGYDFVIEAATVHELIDGLDGREVDVVVLDLSLGDGSTVTEGQIEHDHIHLATSQTLDEFLNGRSFDDEVVTRVDKGSFETESHRLVIIDHSDTNALGGAFCRGRVASSGVHCAGHVGTYLPRYTASIVAPNDQFGAATLGA